MHDSRKITIGRWMLRLFAWDGLLPPLIWLLPTILRKLIPNNDTVVILMTVLIPIGAVFIRFYVGMGYIRENRCGPIMRGFQRCILFCAIVLMILVDTFSIAMQDIAPLGEQAAFALIVFVFYLPLMAVALYPGFPNHNVYENACVQGETTRLNAFGGEEHV